MRERSQSIGANEQYPPPLLPLSSDEADSQPQPTLGLFLCPDNRSVELIDIQAPPLLARSAGTMRPLARRFAQGLRPPPPALVERAGRLETDGAEGRVHSGGTFVDEAAHAELAGALGGLGAALRPRFEWYWCRGAFFHTDAHYADVLFGVWAVCGPPADVVFARSAQRVEIKPGTIVVFDPFEVHGVLARGTLRYEAAAYRASDRPSIFAGFEIALDEATLEHFGGVRVADAHIISSATRIAADTGQLD